jgi:inorganic triphosphatase YgiF
LESELKFELDPATADQLLEELALAAKGEELILKSVYYDTKDAHLRCKGLALRVREAGGRRVQTVKQSGASLIDRGEWESEVTGPAPDLDAALDSPLADALKGAGAGALKPAFEVTVERARRILPVGKAVIEVALDRGAVSAEGCGAPICELELELKSGAPASLFELARRLSNQAPLSLSFMSKAERGYALLDGALLSPAKARRQEIASDANAETAFRAIAGSNLVQITANARVLRAARRPEAVHQLRVGIRRLRTAIVAFGPMLADNRREAMKDELKWMTGELNDARNLDVFIADSFRPAAARRRAQAGLSALGASLLSAQTTAYDRVEKAVRSRRCGQMMLELAAWIEAGPWTRTTGQAIAALRERPARVHAAEVIGKHHRKVIKRGRKLESLEPEARHHLRIQAKKLRYAGDFFTSLYTGKDARRLKTLTKALSAFQDGLGELNDITVGAGLIAGLVGAGAESAPKTAKLPAASDPARAFAAGQVCADREATAGKAMQASLEAYERLAKAEPYW